MAWRRLNLLGKTLRAKLFFDFRKASNQKKRSRSAGRWGWGVGGGRLTDTNETPTNSQKTNSKPTKTVFEVTEAGGGKVTDERKLDDIRRVS